MSTITARWLTLSTLLDHSSKLSIGRLAQVGPSPPPTAVSYEGGRGEELSCPTFSLILGEGAVAVTLEAWDPISI